MGTSKPAAVIHSNARFSLLSDGLIRMEFSSTGQFEDRKSVRALHRPEPIPFTKVSRRKDLLTLSSPRLIVRYRPDGQPFSANNLQVLDARTHKKLWRPGQVDEQNLGGAHVSIDVMHRDYTPKGVHPATTDYHPNGDHWNLWSCRGKMGEMSRQEPYRSMSLDQVLAYAPLESYPAPFQEIIRERAKFPPGLLSRAGYFLYNDSATPLWDESIQWLSPRANPNPQDYYLFVYGKDFAQALADYRRLFGPAQLPPRYSLGIWYSRADTPNDKELLELAAKFRELNLPLDVLVLDLHWHTNGWSGWDWNLNHIREPEKFLKDLHDDKIFNTLCVHPCGFSNQESRFEEFLKASGMDYDRTNAKPGAYLTTYDPSIRRHSDAYLDVFHTPVMKQGVDFWFVDGPTMTNNDVIERNFWTDHVYWKHIEENFADRRPMILSRSGGFGSHRYPFHFTGDTHCQWEVLESQVEFTLRAGHMGLSFMTHDIGGFMSPPFDLMDPRLYCRWVQWGALSPILRLHSGGMGERRPWMYDKMTLESFRQAVTLRMELLPYLYSMAWNSHTTGLPVCRSNALMRPDWERGYGIWDSFFLGDRLYAAPIVTPSDHRHVTLPPGAWYSGITGQRHESTGETPLMVIAGVEKAPLHFIRAGSVLVRQPFAQRAAVLPDTLIVELYSAGPGARDSFDLYEDDGLSREHRNGSHSLTRFELEESASGIRLTQKAASGTFAGQPSCRTIEVRLFGAKPTGCRLNDKTIEPQAVEGKPYWVVRTPEVLTRQTNEWLFAME